MIYNKIHMPSVSVHHASEVACALCLLELFGVVAYFSTTALSLTLFCPLLPLSFVIQHHLWYMCDHQSQRSGIL